jgi:hypothetical protein
MRDAARFEKELIDAFGRVVHQDHPNPDRAKCPGKAALRALAFEPESSRSETLLDHLKNCAPCLDELRKLRASIANDQN